MTLASATEQPSPEILHTAEDANQSAQAAATAAAVEALLGPAARVDVENPAAAAMAAAELSSESFETVLADDDDALQRAVAGLGIEMTSFDPGGDASVFAFSPFSDEPASAGQQIDPESAQAPAMFEVDHSARAAVEHWADADAMGHAPFDAAGPPQAEFSDAADLVAALQSPESATVSDSESLFLQMPSGADGLFDAELTTFEEPEAPAALQPQMAAIEDLSEVSAQATGVTALLEPEIAPEIAEAAPAIAALAIDEAAVEPARDLIASADMFELSAMKSMDVVVSARAYDVSAPPPEDSASLSSPVVPAAFLDEERVADVGRFELPDTEVAFDESAIDDVVPALALTGDAGSEDAESSASTEALFALTSPVLSDAADVALSADVADAGTVETDNLLSRDTMPTLEFGEPAALAESIAERIEDVPEVALEPEFVPDLNYALETAEVVTPVDSEPAPAMVASSLAALVGDAVEAHVSAEIVRMAAHAQGKKAAVASLERFLRQIQHRRLQLESGSVA